MTNSDEAFGEEDDINYPTKSLTFIQEEDLS